MPRQSTRKRPAPLDNTTIADTVESSLPDIVEDNPTNAFVNLTQPIDFSALDATRQFLAEIRDRLSRFVHADEASLLPSWDPPPATIAKWGPSGAQIAQHIRETGIPTADIRQPSPDDAQPSLLLHNLGEFSRDRTKERLVKNLLKPKNMMLINTAGSGKTRLILESLCVSWGMYFVCHPIELGSQDLQLAMTSGLDEYHGYFRQTLPEPAGEADRLLFNVLLNINRYTARRQLSLVLLSRLLIFKEFIEIVKSTGNNDTRHWQKRWLLLQLCPYILDNFIGGFTAGQNDSDIFYTLANKLDHADNLHPRFSVAQPLDSKHLTLAELNDTQEGLFVSLSAVKNNVDHWVEHIGGRLFKIFRSPKYLRLVVDEAQVAADLYTASFRSDKSIGLRRPIIRELLLAWQVNTSKGFHPTILFSGTGLGSKQLHVAFSSLVLKRASFTTVTETGCFIKLLQIDSYMRTYIPPYLLSTEEWQELRRRCWYWLRGRHRILATFIELLIRYGFRTPHLLLNEYIRVFSQHLPTDALRFLRADVELLANEIGEVVLDDIIAYINLECMKSITSDIQNSIICLDFGEIEACGLNFIASVQKIVYARQMRFGIKLYLGLRHAEWVRLGLARYVDNQNDARYDEALPHLALEDWMSATEKKVVGKFMYYTKHATSDQTGNNGLENLLALYVAHTFGQWRKLDDIFEFDNERNAVWSGCRARLVTYHLDVDKRPFYSPVRFPIDSSAQSASHVLGFSATEDDHVVKWLEHHSSAQAAPICFPTKSMGPDVLFFLEIEGKGAVCCAMQVKLRTEQSDMPPGKAMAAFASVTPENFFTEHNRDRTLDAKAPALRALSNLSGGMQIDAPPYNVLRGLCCFPRSISARFKIAEYQSSWDNEAHVNYVERCRASVNPAILVRQDVFASETAHFPPEEFLAELLLDKSGKAFLPDIDDDPILKDDLKLAQQTLDRDDAVLDTVESGRQIKRRKINEHDSMDVDEQQNIDYGVSESMDVDTPISQTVERLPNLRRNGTVKSTDLSTPPRRSSRIASQNRGS